jgi:hypothetical protein
MSSLPDLIHKLELLTKSLEEINKAALREIIPLVNEIIPLAKWWRASPSAGKGERTAAPRGFVIDLLIPPQRAEDMLLHLDKAFPRWVVKYGPRRAKQMYHLQSIGAVSGFWIEWLRQKADVFKWFA